MYQLNATIYGRVQGVAFRWNTRRKAEKLGVKGHARNESDGTVSIVAQGKKEDLDALCEFLRRGPPFSRVDNAEFSFEEIPGYTYDRFEVK